ncbi:MAG: 4-alpha-glucanotransferase [Defluviitaleaceae bacterium]|nr:4-alpha-glucanotransferase [Defluviitaleaceae bacterium]
MNRASGIIAHPTSFPGEHGIGDLGGGAYEFINFLAAAKQTLWQVLPLGPTSYGDSPYQSFSSFAGNPYMISPDLLFKQGYLFEEDLLDIPEFDPRTADYGKMIDYKMPLLKKAFKNYKLLETRGVKGNYTKFCARNADWINDYALFVALKNHFIAERKTKKGGAEFKAYRKANKKYLTENQILDYYYGAVWNSWPEPLARRDLAAMNTYSVKLADEIEFHKFLQFEFFNQWENVKQAANSKGIKIIGDIPIFVAFDSSDTWAGPSLFYLDEELQPTVVAGVPPDYFSETGQLWGNPLYNWENHKKSGYEWWTRRIESTLKLVDIIRIDHFRGFESYWAVPYGEKTAARGKWTKGPGGDLFDAIVRQLGHLPIIAEDLGIITPAVTDLRESLELPGMKVLQFAFDPEAKGLYAPHNYTSTRTVVYTGTHDNDTSRGWYEFAPEDEKDYFRRYLNVSGESPAWDLIRLAYSSTANFAVAPIQDVMDLETDARMNVPGVPAGNWRFRYTSDMLTDELAERLAYLAALYNRLPDKKKKKSASIL